MGSFKTLTTMLYTRINTLFVFIISTFLLMSLTKSTTTESTVAKKLIQITKLRFHMLHCLLIMQFNLCSNMSANILQYSNKIKWYSLKKQKVNSNNDRRNNVAAITHKRVNNLNFIHFYTKILNFPIVGIISKYRCAKKG